MTQLLPVWVPIVVFIITTTGFSHGEGEVTRKRSRSFFENGPCYHDEFWCSNDECVSKSEFCNGVDDCGDNSDELYCRSSNCPIDLPVVCIVNYYERKCLPLTWRCDDVSDCDKSEDEITCPIEVGSLNLQKVLRVRQAAINWTLQERDGASTSQKWGTEVTRKVVAWYLGDYKGFLRSKSFSSEMAYEVNISLLNRLALRTIEAVSSTTLASYVNAFLVTCIDPRDYVVDLVRELRQRVDASNDTHPFVILALCNAGDQITERDVEKVNTAFWNAHQNFRTDVQAFAVLALSCAARQSKRVIDYSEIRELNLELKQKQYSNGTVERLETTALVMQALYASEIEADEENFDESKALQQILRSQQADGSFGNVVSTYYILHVLAFKSLINVSSSHCKKTIKYEKESFQHLMNLVRPKWRIRYSLWIGNNRSLERALTLKVPVNTSVYGIMEYAAGVDTKFKFQSVMRDGKPYVYSISGMQDDPENSMFWFPYLITEKADEFTVITESLAAVVPKEGQHLMFWYKSDPLL